MDTNILTASKCAVIDIFTNFRAFLANTSAVERTAYIFFVLGPFFMLIERSPADAWLSLCAIFFLFRCVWLKYWNWLEHFWVRSVLVFWMIALLSASLSTVPLYSLSEALIWIRFPLFAMAVVFFFCKDSRVFYAFVGALFVGMLLMSGILLSEFLIVGPINDGRLTWPYGDLMPGSYLAKACFPVFIGFLMFCLSRSDRIKTYGLLLLALPFIMLFLTGERMNFLILSGGVFVALLVSPSGMKKAVVFLSILVALVGVSALSGRYFERFVVDFFYAIPIFSDSPYLMAWNGGVAAFFSQPIFGIGPDAYRLLCPDLAVNAENIRCHTQPHNYFIQIAGEMGVLGLISAVFMFGAIVKKAFSARQTIAPNCFALSAFISPLVFFFPLQTTGDFFGQFTNVFVWSALGVVLAASELSSSSKNT